MDRNIKVCPVILFRVKVALRKESVDRNILPMVILYAFIGSLSARRAWIEIRDLKYKCDQTILVALRKESVDRNSEDWLNAGSLSVALRKESVDRNVQLVNGDVRLSWSLSARRAWIEISMSCSAGK